jgi:transcriptional regulator with XRE-family HTH domain
MVACEQKQEQAQDQDTRKAIALTFKFLKERGIDQNAIAARLGVGPQIISMTKTGKRPASIRQVATLARLAQDALSTGSLTQDEWILASQLTLAWREAIHAQMGAVAAMQQHVSRQLTSLQTADEPLTPEDLQRIAAYAADLHGLGIGLRHLAELGQVWQAEGRRLVETWERVKAERYPDGAPRQSHQEETQPRLRRRVGA